MLDNTQHFNFWWFLLLFFFYHSNLSPCPYFVSHCDIWIYRKVKWSLHWQHSPVCNAVDVCYFFFREGVKESFLWHRNCSSWMLLFAVYYSSPLVLISKLFQMSLVEQSSLTVTYLGFCNLCSWVHVFLFSTDCQFKPQQSKRKTFRYGRPNLTVTDSH